MKNEVSTVFANDVKKARNVINNNGNSDKKSNKNGSWILCTVILILCSACLFLYVMNRVESDRLSREIANLNKQISTLQSESAKIDIQLKAKEESPEIKEYIKENFDVADKETLPSIFVEMNNNTDNGEVIENKKEYVNAWQVNLSAILEALSSLFS